MIDARRSPPPKRLPELVGYAEVAAEFGVSRRTIERMVRKGKFPAPLQITDNTVRWELATVNAWFEERKQGLAARAVENPDQLAPDLIAPAMRQLGARLVAAHIGEPVAPEQIRLLFERTLSNSALAEHRGHLLAKFEELFHDFDYWRALLVALAVFPALRARFAEEVGPERDPEHLRELAIASIDDEMWAEIERSSAERNLRRSFGDIDSEQR